MKIYIVGAGAIGKALAVCLQVNGRSVELLRGSVDNGKCVNQNLTVRLKNGENLSTYVKVNSLSNVNNFDGIVVLTNKSFGNRSLAEKLISKIGSAPIVLMQNGLGVEDAFTKCGFKEVYRSILFVTSQIGQNGEVSYKSVADSPIGVVQQHQTRLEEVVQGLDTPQFRFVVESSIDRIVWKKTIINCVFNSICPLLEEDNGVFYQDEKVFSLAKRIISECLEISREKGIDLGSDEVEKQILDISKMSDGQYISTLQDIMNKNETEIETLNLEVYRIALGLGLGEKVKETKLLGELIKLKSELKR